MSSDSVFVRFLAILAIILISVVVFFVFIRPWHMKWGATEAEVERHMPGDDQVVDREFAFTRALTIDAAPEEVWPWVLQMGEGRAGFYSYDWFDNGGVRSSEVIVPELQKVEVGDIIPIGGSVQYRVASVDPARSVVWVSDDEPISGSWAWVLYATDDGKTRLISRMSGRTDPGLDKAAAHWVIDAGDIVFMRKSMRGIQQRAEGSITDTFGMDVLEGAYWGSSLVQFLLAVWLILRIGRWYRAWPLALTIAAVFMFSFYVRPPLAIAGALQLATFVWLLWIYYTERTEPQTAVGHPARTAA